MNTHSLIRIGLAASLAALSGCVSVGEYRALLEKYAHTLAIKNEIDRDYGDLRRQVSLLEQQYAQAATSLAEAKHALEGARAQAATQASELEKLKAALTKQEQRSAAAESALSQLQARLAQVTAATDEVRRQLADWRAAQDTAAAERTKQMEELRKEVRRLRRATAKPPASEPAAPSPGRARPAKPAPAAPNPPEEPKASPLSPPSPPASLPEAPPPGEKKGSA